MIYDPLEHEPCTRVPFAASAAQRFIVETVTALDALFDEEHLWALHPEDRYAEDDGPPFGVYCGAAGTIWGLTRLAERYNVALRHDYAGALERLEQRMRSEPGAVPSYAMGTSGVSFARYALSGDESALQRCMNDARANLANPTREFLWGAPGTIVPALLLRERGERRFDAIIADVQEAVWSAWDEATQLWTQDMYGKQQRYTGAGHGAASNVAVFLRAPDLLSSERQERLPERISALLARYELSDGTATNWWSLGEPTFGNRLQWCHGAPGVIMSLRRMPKHDRVDSLLDRAGDAIERAGALRKSPSICHGTAGNGFALLYLALRTGEERRLNAARTFAAHAMAQCAGWEREFGMRSASLMTGDTGVALFIDSVLRGEGALLSIDAL